MAIVSFNLNGIVTSVNSTLPDVDGNVELTIPASTNIYNSDGTLSENRIVSASDNSLEINANTGSVTFNTTDLGDQVAVSAVSEGVGISATGDNRGGVFSSTTGQGIIASGAATGGSFISQDGVGIFATCGADGKAGHFLSNSETKSCVLIEHTNDNVALEVISNTNQAMRVEGRIYCLPFAEANSPEDCAAVQIDSTDRGLLIPRMTSVQRNAIVSPVSGLTVYDMDTFSEWSYDGTIWKENLVSGYILKDLNYNITVQDRIVDCTGTIAVMLPTAVDKAGREYTIFNSGSGTVTIDTAFPQTINGASNYVLNTTFSTITVFSDGENWKIKSLAS